MDCIHICISTIRGLYLCAVKCTFQAMPRKGKSTRGSVSASFSKMMRNRWPAEAINGHTHGTQASLFLHGFASGQTARARLLAVITLKATLWHISSSHSGQDNKLNVVIPHPTLYSFRNYPIRTILRVSFPSSTIVWARSLTDISHYCERQYLPQLYRTISTDYLDFGFEENRD